MDVFLAYSMTQILAVNPHKLILQVAKELEKESAISQPEWSKFVKTGHHKQRLPLLDNWWHVRSAAILRTIARIGPVGTEKLRTKYGGRKNRGHKPDRRYKASGSVIRKSLQQLESAGLIQQKEVSGHKGRVLTPKGVSLLDKTAIGIMKEEKNGSK